MYGEAGVNGGGWWPLVAALAVALLGGLIGAVQAVMLADFLPLTTRTAGSGNGGLPFSQLVASLLPNFYGNPSRSDYWGAGNFNETTIYVGIVALFLALLALPRARKLPLTAAIAGVATLCLLYLVLGGPGTGLLQAFPVISQVPLSRFAFLLPLLVGWLAAVIVDDTGLSARAVLITACAVRGRGRLAGGDLLERRHCRQPAPAAGGCRRRAAADGRHRGGTARADSPAALPPGRQLGARRPCIRQPGLVWTQLQPGGGSGRPVSSRIYGAVPAGTGRRGACGRLTARAGAVRPQRAGECSACRETSGYSSLVGERYPRPADRCRPGAGLQAGQPCVEPPALQLSAAAAARYAERRSTW